MTTEATQGPQPATPHEMDSSDVREVYRALGSLERGQAEIKERLDRQDQRFDRQDQRFDRQDERSDRQFAEVNRRIDRLTYTIIGGIVALGVALILQNVFGG